MKNKSIYFMLLDFTLLSSLYLLVYLIPLNYFILIPIAVLCANRWNAIGILMHDAVHYSFHTNKRINDIIGCVLANFVMLSFKDYRIRHLQHHYQALDDKDHDRQAINFISQIRIPLTFKIFFSPILATIYHKKIKKIYQTPPIKPLLFVAIYFQQFIFIIFFAWLSWRLALFYIATLYIAYFFSVLRVLIEHSYDGSRKTWNFLHNNLLLNNSIYAHAIGYHSLHHLYPHIPFYKLSKLHKEMIGKKDSYKKILEIKGGIFIFYTIWKIIIKNLPKKV